MGATPIPAINLYNIAMNDENVELFKQAADNFDMQAEGLKRLAFEAEGTVKVAFAPAPPPAGPAMAPPPGDPNAAPPPPPGPPPGDPNAAPPGPPPGDPNAAGGPPPQGGGLPPELEQMLGDLANGVQGMAQTQEQQQGALDQLSKRLLDMEGQLGDLKNALKGPMPVDDAPDGKDEAAAAEAAEGAELPPGAVPPGA